MILAKIAEKGHFTDLTVREDNPPAPRLETAHKRIATDLRHRLDAQAGTEIKPRCQSRLVECLFDGPGKHCGA